MHDNSDEKEDDSDSSGEPFSSARHPDSDKMFRSSFTSISVDQLSVNKSFIKKPFHYYEGLDKARGRGESFRRSTTLVLNGNVEEYEYEDFYEEIEHLIRQENI